MVNRAPFLFETCNIFSSVRLTGRSKGGFQTRQSAIAAGFAPKRRKKCPALFKPRRAKLNPADPAQRASVYFEACERRIANSIGQVT